MMATEPHIIALFFFSCLLYFIVLPLFGFVAGYSIERLSLLGVHRSSRLLYSFVGCKNTRSLQPWWNALVKTISSVFIVHAFIFFEGISSSNYSLLQYIQQNGFSVRLILRLLCFSVGLGMGSAFQPVGLTGGIACGKSTVSKILSEDQR